MSSQERKDKIRLLRLLREKYRREAQKDLLTFIEYTKPNYEAQWFHRIMCQKLDDFEKGTIKKLMIWLPPQHGKSEISTRRYPAYTLGKNPNQKLAVVAYNHTFSSKFNRDVQRIIDSDEYLKAFPGTILNQSNFRTISGSYLRNNDEFEVVNASGGLVSVGVGGGLTGRMVDKLIIDDIYKDTKDAWSPVIQENVWEWYSSVAETRLHNDSQQLIVFTRWHENDLAGKLMSHEPDQWEVVKFPALKTDEFIEGDIRSSGDPLWPERHNLEKLLGAKKKNAHAFENLYQQDPKPREGLLYNDLMVYSDLPDDEKATIKAYVDVADAGKDYLCSVAYLESNSRAFIIDVIYTTEGTGVTEGLVSEQFTKHNVNSALIESNSGGGAFARNVERLMRDQGNNKTQIIPFHQSNNKIARIHTEASTVMNSLYFPEYWHAKFPLFYDAVTGYSKSGSNKHDDAPDVLTGIAEELNIGGGFFFG